MTTDTSAVPLSTTTATTWSARATVMVAGPLLVLASELAAPRWPEGLSPQDDAAFILDNQQRFLVSGLLGIAAGATMVVAFVLVATTAWNRGRTLMRVAAAVGIAGSIGLVMHQTTLLDGRDVLMADPGAYDAVRSLADGASTLLAIVLVVLCLDLAWILLAAGAKRAGLAGWWVVVAGVLSFVADFSPTNWNTALWSLPALAVAVVVGRGLTGDAGR
jgi:hypothetical protein